jgi:putative tricarboxylic transport membrane protein
MTDRLAALAVLVAAGAYLAAALPLPRGVAARPGAGFFPLVVGVLFCLVAAAFVIETFRRPSARAATVAANARIRAFSTAGALVGFVLLLPWLGYPAVTFLFVTAMLRALGGSWILALATASAAAAGSYYLFAVLLAVPLPKGVLFD